jgi:hypothetical protein
MATERKIMAMEFDAGFRQDYIWQDNGTGGVNYFQKRDIGGMTKLVPVSREDFATNTGEDVGAIENWVADQYQPGQLAPAETAPSYSGAGTGGGTGGGLTFPIWFNGQQYHDEASYVNAVNNLINQNYTKSTQNAQKMYQNGLISLDEMEDQIRTNRKSLIKQRDENLQGTSGYFSRISPNVLQSQQARYEGMVNENFNEANTKLGGIGVNQSYRNLNPADFANDISEYGKLVRGYRDLGESTTGAMQDAEQNRLNDISEFNNDMAENNVRGAIDPQFNSPVMSDLSAYGNWQGDYQNRFNTGGQFGSGFSSTSGKKYDYWGNELG